MKFTKKGTTILGVVVSMIGNGIALGSQLFMSDDQHTAQAGEKQEEQTAVFEEVVE